MNGAFIIAQTDIQASATLTEIKLAYSETEIDWIFDLSSSVNKCDCADKISDQSNNSLGELNLLLFLMIGQGQHL